MCNLIDSTIKIKLEVFFKVERTQACPSIVIESTNNDFRSKRSVFNSTIFVALSQPDPCRMVLAVLSVLVKKGDEVDK